MRQIRWSFWAILGAGALAWVILGFTLTRQDFPANDVYDGAAIAAFFTPLLFIIIYTVAGFLGPAKWWKTNLGTYFILAAVSVLGLVGPTVFAIMFHHGVIDTWWWAWTWIGGNFLAAAVWGLLASLRLRSGSNGNGAERPAGK